MPLQALPLKILHRQAGRSILKLFADRVAQDLQTAVCTPVIAKAIAEPVAGFGEVSAALIRCAFDRLEWMCFI